MRIACLLTALTTVLILGHSRDALAQEAPSAADYRADALELLPLIRAKYAYLDRFPSDVVPTSPALQAEAEAVSNSQTLLRYAGHALFALADHHAITGSSFSDDWAIVPSYADLWIVREGEAFVVDAVRTNSPAEAAGVQPGERLIAVENVEIDTAVRAFRGEIGLSSDRETAAFAARVLAAGRRDRPRVLTFAAATGVQRRLTLPNLYAPRPDRPRLESRSVDGLTVIRINDSLGDTGLIDDFDAAMADIPRDAPLVLDLTDTPGGGNTVVARAILGWFAAAPTGYQIHNLPSEERETGIARQWVEQVLPRPGKHHTGPVTVRVGRWTGSMGEGLAIGFDALGARVEGGPMAGLLGAISDLSLPRSGLVIKLPTERLSSIEGLPRENFRPEPISTVGAVSSPPPTPPTSGP